MSEVKRRIDVRLIAVIVGAALLIVGYWGIVVLSREYYQVGAPGGSTFNSGSTGAQLLLRYLDELGIEAHTLRRFDELPEGGTIVVIAQEPFEQPATNADVRTIRAWIEAGGRLVMIGPWAAELPRGSLSGSTTMAQEEHVTLEPLIPSVYTQGVDEIMIDETRMLVDDTAWVAHFKDIEGQVLVSRTFGEGEVVWLSSTYPVSNAGLGEADNARLATLLVAQDQPVYFDEYHHGLIDESGVWDRLGGNGRASVLLVLAAVTIAIVAAARRLAPAIDRPEPHKVRTGAYIGSLADLYRKAGARVEALATLEEGLRSAVVRRYGSLAAAGERGSAAVQVMERSARLREAGSMSEEQFTEMARELARARQEVEGRHD